MRKFIFLIISAFFLMAASDATPPTPKRYDRGAQLAGQLCGSCHASSGVGEFSTYPIIAGQNKLYLIKQLEDFKAGSRSHVYMNNVATTLSAADIQAVAAFYACSGVLSVEQPGCSKNPKKPLDDVQ